MSRGLVGETAVDTADRQLPAGDAAGRRLLRAVHRGTRSRPGAGAVDDRQHRRLRRPVAHARRLPRLAGRLVRARARRHLARGATTGAGGQRPRARTLAGHGARVWRCSSSCTPAARPRSTMVAAVVASEDPTEPLPGRRRHNRHRPLHAGPGCRRAALGAPGPRLRPRPPRRVGARPAAGRPSDPRHRANMEGSSDARRVTRCTCTTMSTRSPDGGASSNGPTSTRRGRAPSGPPRLGSARGVDRGAVLHLQRLAGNAGVSSARRRRVGAGALARCSTSSARVAARRCRATFASHMESHLGADFGDVRVHDDGAAADVGAGGQRQGVHGRQRRRVRSRGLPARHARGPHTLAHELTHVVQQRSGPVDGTLHRRRHRPQPSRRPLRAARPRRRPPRSGAP